MTTTFALDAPRLPGTADATRRGTIAVAVLGLAALLGTLALAAVLLPAVLGPAAPPSTPLEQQVAASTPGVPPTRVSCPAGLHPAAGDVITCTGTVEGHPTSYTVTWTDDAGHLAVTGDVAVAVAAVESRLRAEMAEKTGLDVIASCDAGGAVVLAVPGSSFPCSVANAQDPGDRLDVTATVTDAAGAVAFSAQG